MRGLWAFTLFASCAWGEIVDSLTSTLLKAEYDFIIVGGTHKAFILFYILSLTVAL